MLPELLIFDIDSTLIRPGMYYTIDEVKNAIFDTNLLRAFFENNHTYQIAIASFNQDTMSQHLPNNVKTFVPYAGKRLARLILDLQHPMGNSKFHVGDDFIQAWMPQYAEQVAQHGKNIHIRNINQAYIRKYNREPPRIHFYDDMIENSFLAGRIGVRSYWVSPEHSNYKGLTSDTMHTFKTIGNKLLFQITNVEASYVKSFLGLSPHATFVRAYDQPANTFTLYLSNNNEEAMRDVRIFMEFLKKYHVQIKILEATLQLL